MSNWITPSGSIGQYSQGQSLSFVFQATPSLGGVVQYFLVSPSVLPSGLTLNPTTGVLSGTPSYVSVNTTTNFRVSATEIVNDVGVTNIAEFSITVSTLVWTTPAGSIGIFGENIPILYQFSATASEPTNTVVYTLLNGNFPAGKTQPLTLNSNGLLAGIPAETSREEISAFTLRAYEYNGSNVVGFRDRTFTITVDLGITAPTFVTPSGELFSINDSVWTNFQINFSNPDPGTTAFVTLVLGALPAGLEIDPSGLIRGYARAPYDSEGNPISLTTEFTLQVSSESGIGISTYSIGVVNQELNPGFIGRAPTILNTRPLSYIISDTDPFEPYYFDGTSLGEYSQDNEFIFKFIGYDFDQLDDLIYEVNGLETIGILNNQFTGWQDGVLPSVGNSIQSYNFTVRVFKSSNTTLTSETFLFSVTVTGNIVTKIDWVTSSDLGTINNGQISDLAISALSDPQFILKYRIIGTEISSNLKTITGTGAEFLTFGDLGAYVTGSANGLDWTNQPDILESVTSLYFTDCVYNQFTENTVLVGYNQINNSVIGQLTNSNQFFASAVITPYAIRGIIENSGTYVAVGDNGTILTTFDPSVWSVQQNSQTTDNLNSICYNSISGVYVVVGDIGAILTSTDLVNWTVRNSSTTINLRSVICTGNRYVAVGDLGTILLSSDGISWSESANSNFDTNLKSVSIDSDGSRLLTVGEDGSILSSTDNGINWQIVVNTISTTNLFGIYYDSSVTKSFYIVGDGGTVLIYNNDATSSQYETLSSPTVLQLPPDLILLPTGEISGRLAFQSTDQVVNQGIQQTYQFTVQAYATEFDQISDSRLFTLTTNQEFYLPYDNIYIQALTGLEDRAKINQLLDNDEIIPPQDLYRADDPYYGKSQSIRYQHMFGVPSIATNDFYQQYVAAVQINHYWRNITLGEISIAIATDVDNVPVYEVVYSRVQDDLINPQGVSISKQIVWPRNIPLNLNDWYTSRVGVSDSATWWDEYPTVKKTVINSTGTTLTLNNVDDLIVGMNVTVPFGQTIVSNVDGTPPTVVSIDSITRSVILSIAQTFTAQTQLLFNNQVYTSLTPGVARTLYPNSLPNMRQQIYDAIGRVNSSTLLPEWMTSLQLDGQILGYTPAWVICYCKPGTGEQIKQNILEKWPYVLNQINFQLDRFEVDRSKTYNYLGTNVNGIPIWDTLPSAQPDVVGNSKNSYVYFPRKTILPSSSQY